MSDADRPPAVKSAARTVELLEALAQAPGRLTLTELANRLGYPKSSIHMLLRTLVGAGWVESDERGTAYGIGVRALLVGTAFLDRDVVNQVATAHLAALRAYLNETVHLARLDGADVVYLASRESMHILRSGSWVGRRVPAHSSAMGQVLLAQLSPEEVEARVPTELTAETQHTIADRQALARELQDVRVRRWAAEREQDALGLGSIAVAIPFGRPAAYGLSCSIPLSRFTDAHQRDVVEALHQHAEEIGGTLRRLPSA
ncbi:IclR family transcriptional regulator [Kribbella sp. NBC_00889]|uniref:IclR family transcriptional regulator n=1 Tax=Kribbella sp. NBC_00889 TaxID=2975974 RepID=UPI003870B4B2|nr:IclR family transcriptional regulator [Kribbella sp. NBC_00889]